MLPIFIVNVFFLLLRVFFQFTKEGKSLLNTTNSLTPCSFYLFFMRENFSELLWAVTAEGEENRVGTPRIKVCWPKINQNYIKIWDLKGVLDAINSQTHLPIIPYSIYSNIK